jgi:cell pole-organizing protein PopZ
MSQPAKLQEPTMEEILASIRRIIADDDSVRPAPVPAKPAAAPAPILAADDDRSDDDDATPGSFDNPQTPGIAANDMFERRDAAPPRPPAITSRAPASDEMFDAHDTEEQVESARPLPPSAPAVTSANPPAPREAALLSPRATAAVDLAFNTLAHTVLVQNSRTLEDLVREMLKPMLKAWLDDNLPNMVERLVRAEIERVSRGRG